MNMLNIALCGHIDFADDGSSATELLESRSRAAGFEGCSITVFDNPHDLVEAATDTKADPDIDVVVIGAEVAGMSGIGLVRELRAETHGYKIVLCEEDYENAVEALDLHIDGYLVAPVAHEDLSALIDRQLAKIREFRDNSVVIRFREGVKRISVSQIVYAETQDHAQVVHLADGTTFTANLSSQGLFDILEPSGCFFKAGSSYMVNLRAVRLVNASQSTAIMADGTAITVPRRVRKALEEAILAS